MEPNVAALQEESKEEETEQCDSVQGRLAAVGSSLIKTAFYSKGLCIYFSHFIAKAELNKKD